jgi:hypothetical protein
MTSLKQGDKIFLFYDFPIADELYEKLPLTITSGIQLIKSPSLDNASGSDDIKENLALAGYVYPGYGLRGTKLCPVSIKIDANIHVSNEKMDLLFWSTILAFIITKPLFIHVIGFYIHGENGFHKGQCNRIDLRSNISLDVLAQDNQENLQYATENLAQVINLLPQIYNLLDSPDKHPRAYYNLVTFLAVAITEKLYLESTAFSRLFTVLDSFSGNTNNKHNVRISSRVANFIIDKSASQPVDELKLQKYLQDQWEIHRTPDIHGHVKLICPDPTQPQKNTFNLNYTEDLFNIFEITRFALLKMLLLPDNDFNSYSKIPLQKFAQQDQDQSLRNQAAETFFATNYPNQPSMKWFATI